MVKVVVVQFEPKIGGNEGNLKKSCQFIDLASAVGAYLVIFPECSLSGYCFESRAEALSWAESVPGPATEELLRKCRQKGLFVVYGMLERYGDSLHNAAVILGPGGIIGKYRKTHLPYIGVDRFVEPGSAPYEVHKVGDLRVGMLICYDLRFPEAVRSLALLGADLLALPTNWPEGSQVNPDFVLRTRAFENHFYVAGANRIGFERGFSFIGRSQVAGPAGNVLCEASGDAEEMLEADLDLSAARQKKRVIVPGRHELDVIKDRRPDLYGSLLAPHTTP